MTTPASGPARVARLLAAALLPIALGTGAAAVSAAPAAAPTAAASAALPGNSVYQLAVALTDQAGRTFRLDERRGRPMLVSMFYTSCQFVCPMLIESIRDTDKQLAPAEREQLDVLLVTFDPAHDSVAVLKHTADERGLDPARWTLARTDPATTRKLASVLGIQYRALANGDFNHTTAILLLDAQGRVVARSSQLGQAEPAFVNRVRAVARAAP
jgi:protein SCO1/2